MTRYKYRCFFYIFAPTLFFLLGSGSQVLALEISGTGRALVSREDKGFTGNSVIKREAYKGARALVSKERRSAAAGGFVVTQETYRTGDVLVSRPLRQDISILNILVGKNIKDLDVYAEWLIENVEYRKDDNGDVWSRPSETLGRRYGDCEDYAFLNASALRILGYEPKVLALEQGIGRNHAICVFKKDGRYLWFDNAELKESHLSSMEEFAEYILTAYRCYYVSEVDFDTRKWELLFKKSAGNTAKLASF